MTPVPINNKKPFNSYIATEGQTIFTFDWYVFKKEYVKVYKNDNLLTYLSDYTVQFTGQTEGGTITLNTPAVKDDAIVISRQSVISRTSNYTESGEFRAYAISNDLNYLVTVLQELSFLLERSVVLSPSDAESTQLSLPNLQDRIGKYLAFDNNGNLTAVPSTSIDLYYNWLRVDKSMVINKLIKKVYTQITSEITLELPQVDSTDDGRELFILNLDSNTFNTKVNANSETVTIDGQEEIILLPGVYKKFVYNHALLRWFTID